MVNLHFELKAFYLLCFVIQNSSPNRFVDGVSNQTVIDFQNAAWKENQQIYNLIRFGLTENFLLQNLSLTSMIEQCNTFLAKMESSQSFKQLMIETRQSLDRVQNEWIENFAFCQPAIDEILGVQLSGTYTVYMTHPALKQGHAVTNLNAICWAHREEWDNYNTIYLWHEVLHLSLPSGELEHAVIQLATDNELRVRLNGGNYPPLIGHRYLMNLMELLTPDWNRYVQSANRNIHTFINEMAEREDVRKELLEIQTAR